MGEAVVAYVVDWRPCGSTDGTVALRQCLRLVEGNVWQFECDLPGAESDPLEVQLAAWTLTTVARWPDRMPPATGTLKPGDPTVWEAFVTFAPFALDGSVWTHGDGHPVVSFSDQGTSIVVRLDSDQAQRLSDLVAPAQLVPAKEWDRRPRQDRA